MKFLENSFTPGNFLEFSAVPAKNLSTFRRKIIDLEEIQKKVRLLKSRKIPRSCKIVQHFAHFEFGAVHKFANIVDNFLETCSKTII